MDSNPWSSQTPAPSRMEDWQATLIAQTLARLDGNVSAAAPRTGTRAQYGVPLFAAGRHDSLNRVDTATAARKDRATV